MGQLVNMAEAFPSETTMMETEQTNKPGAISLFILEGEHSTMEQGTIKKCEETFKNIDRRAEKTEELFKNSVRTLLSRFRITLWRMLRNSMRTLISYLRITLWRMLRNSLRTLLYLQTK